MQKQALYDIDLAGSWDFLPEGGEWTTIQVPGGGWLKQGFDCEAGTYQRRLEIPVSGQAQVVHLELGAVNHIAEYYIGEDEGSLQKIHSEVTAFTSQVVDLTPYVQEGKTYLLRIFVRAYQNGRPVAPHWAEWCECIARGIFREARLRVYPEVFITDAHVKTSVAQGILGYDIWVTNASNRDQTVIIDGTLSPWGGGAWQYPTIPAQSLMLPEGTTRKLTSGRLAWTCGPESYWWPNVSYQPGYRARLHVLNLALRAGENTHTASVRFGFRELHQAGSFFELNGVRVNFRGDNLQVANYDRVDFGGKGDAIDTLPGAHLPEYWGTEGIRIGVQEVTRLGATPESMSTIARWMAGAICGDLDAQTIATEIADFALGSGPVHFTWNDLA